MQAYGINESNFIDTIEGIEEIKSHTIEQHVAKITNKIYQFLQSKVSNLGMIRLKYNFLSEFIGTLLILSTFSLTSFLIFMNTLSIGELVAIVSVISGMIISASRLAASNIQVQEARVAFNRLFEFVQIGAETTTANPNTKTTNALLAIDSIHIKNLTFRFPGRTQLLSNIELHVRKGEVIAIVGESGSGKSTLLRIIQRFYEPESGELLINEISSWGEIDLLLWRKNVAYIPQEIKLFNGSVIDNICLIESTPTDKDSVIKFCNELGLHDFFQSLPQAFDTLLGEGGVKLSGGQKQIIAFTRALYKKPQILLLDEPTSAMDERTETFILKMLDQKRENISCIMVTHRIPKSLKIDRVYLLNDSKINEGLYHGLLISSQPEN